jgi:hypothetical protein
MNEEQWQNEFAESMREWEKFKKKRALKALFHKCDFNCEFTEKSKLVKVFYWLKTFICIVLNRTYGDYYNSLAICSYDEYQCYESLSWDCVWCNKGIFKNWQVCIGTDGT